jgi:crotonobetainyl-CoA:carnitine CoA-transferase CaiB-like acyl-CoA transferase
MGKIPYGGAQFRISGYNGGPRSPGPCLGEHSFDVMLGLLGMSDDEISELVTSGGLG